MPEADEVVDMNLTSSFEWTSSLIENLGKTFAELEAQEDSCIDNIPWKDVEGHFRYLESVMKKKLEELDAKEKEVTEKESLLAEREAVVTAKEQDLLDRMQELKDAAVSAIMEARAVYKAYLKELRRNLQGNGDAETQNNYNAQELAAIKSVMRCVKEYKLEADYPLDQLRKRFVQLQNSVSDRKRKREKGKRRQNGSQDVKESHETKVLVSESTRHNPPPFLEEGGAYTGLTERHSSAFPSAYNYSLSSQIPYAAQANDRGTFGYTLSSQSIYAAPVNDENPYHYSQVDRASVPYSTTAASYSAYTQPPQPPYM